METVIITGANRGIGFELTRRFLQADAKVIATCRNPADASALNALSAEGRLAVFPLELTDGASLSAFCAGLTDRCVDVLVNNAGIMGGERQSLAEMDHAAWLRTFDVNTIAPFRLATALLGNLKQAERPRIVTLSSQMASLARKSTGSYAYRSSKAALNKVMQVLALELAADGIIVCPVHPGWVKTDMGGPAAAITARESAAGLFDLIDSLTQEQAGRFWTWQGEEHPW